MSGTDMTIPAKAWLGALVERSGGATSCLEATWPRANPLNFSILDQFTEACEHYRHCNVTSAMVFAVASNRRAQLGKRGRGYVVGHAWNLARAG